MANSSISHNEYSIWILRDKHALAYKALTTPVAQRMAKIMRLKSATTAPRCLACHSLSVPQDKKGRDFDISEGVTCESCHGPASGWLGEHTLRGWTHQQSVARGMYDILDLRQRTQQCLTCHMGTRDKNVDHELIAAGHPNLVFDLDSYSAVMPMHWKKPPDPAGGIRAWSVGQAVELQQGLERLAWRAKGPVWPEFSEMECFACHHDLTTPDKSWRQERGYDNRAPGSPPWNASHYAVLRVVVKTLDPSDAGQLEQDFDDVFAQASRLDADRTALAERATKAAATARKIADTLNASSFDRNTATRLIAAIMSNADELAAQGTLAAEQTAMALESLVAAQGRENDAQVHSAIDALFQELQNPSAYSGPRFAAQMKRVSGVIELADN